MTSKPQQHRITIHDLQIESDDVVTYCFCCCKPILEQSCAIRTIEFEREFLESFSVDKIYQESIIYSEQCRFLKSHTRSRVPVCFMCEPNIKKSIQEWRENKPITYFSKFMVDTLWYLERPRFKIEKNSLWKGVLCLSTSITSNTTPKNVHYHVCRCKQFEVLEGVIAVVLYHFRSTGCTLRETKISLFQICAILRFKFSGMCTFRIDVDIDMHYYKKSIENKTLHRLLGAIWPYMNSHEYTIEFMHTGENATCSGCMLDKEMKELQKDLLSVSYLNIFSIDTDAVIEKNRHSNAMNNDTVVLSRSVICFNSETISFRSFTYYKQIASAFPRAFIYDNIHEYYNDAYRLHALGQ